jgi:aconitate hydratase
MLGQPVYFLTPDVVGFEFSGRLREGVTATDLVLAVTEILRKEKVVGKFVEFYGAGTEGLSVPDRATMANMAPEYGATMGFFPVDDKTIEYFEGTGRTKQEIEAFQAYQGARPVWRRAPARSTFRKAVRLDLGTVAPSLAGPKRLQDRIEIGNVMDQFTSLFSKSRRRTASTSPPGTGRRVITFAPPSHANGRQAATNVPRTPSVQPGAALRRRDGRQQADLAAALHKAGPATAEQRPYDRQRRRPVSAITSCTNTSNRA